jgi:CRP-like cAMP-binding protein
MPLARPAFEGQAIDALRKACPCATVAGYPPKTLLFSQGLPADSVFLVASGMVKLTHVDSMGKEIIVGVRRKGWLLGAAAVILNQSQPVGAVTLTHCRLMKISAAHIRDLIGTESVTSRCLHELQAYEVHGHLLSLMELATHSTEFRLANLLYELLFATDSSQPAMRCGIKIPFKQWEIAELLAVTPEHICRVLRHLQEKGLVLRKGKCLFVSEPKKLLIFLDNFREI